MRCLFTFFMLLIPVAVAHTSLINETMFEPPDSDVELLAKLVYMEAGGELFKGQWAVADVVVYISEIINWTVKRTIMESGKFDGFHPGMSKINARDIPKSCMRAAKLALAGKHILPGGMYYFFNPRTATDTIWINSLPPTRSIRIGNHVFCCRNKYII